VTASFELRPQGSVVVDFAIENDPKRAVLVTDGLMASREVNDAEAAHAEANGAVGVDAVVIRSAMGHDIAHPPDCARFNSGSPRELHHPSNTAHGS
jgi:hypothetical protein